MNQIAQLIEQEYWKVGDILEKHIDGLKKTLPAMDDEEWLLHITYNIADKVFEINTKILWEDHSFRGEEFNAVFSLWQSIREAKTKAIEAEVYKIEKEIKRIQDFIEMIPHYMEIEIVFTADSPSIAYNINKKFNFIKAILSENAAIKASIL